MSCRRSCGCSSCGCGGSGGGNCHHHCGGHDYCDRPNGFGPFIFAFLAIVFGLFFLDGLSTQNRVEPYSAPPLEQRW